MNHQLLRFAPVAIAAALALTACNRQETPAPKTAAPAPAPAPAKAAGSDVVKIGHVGPISGAIAHLGKDNENGAVLAVEEINAAGGVKLGRPDRQARAGDRRRQSRSEGRHVGRAEDDRRRCCRAGRSFEFGHDDSSVEAVFGREPVAHFPVSHRGQIDRAGLQNDVSRRRSRRQARRRSGQLCRWPAESEVRCGHRRSHTVWPRSGRRVREVRQGKRHEGCRARIHERQGERLQRHFDQGALVEAGCRDVRRNGRHGRPDGQADESSSA